MEKIIIRTNTILSVSSAFIKEYEENEEIYDLMNRLGKEGVLKKIFGEKEEDCYSLFKEYESFLRGEKSSYFSWMYLVHPKFGVVLDEHIYLYHYNVQIYEQYRNWIPWGYTESKKYLGDTWWAEDKEILLDLQELSIIDFLNKYKGY